MVQGTLPKFGKNTTLRMINHEFSVVLPYRLQENWYYNMHQSLSQKQKIHMPIITFHLKIKIIPHNLVTSLSLDVLKKAKHYCKRSDSFSRKKQGLYSWPLSSKLSIEKELLAAQNGKHKKYPVSLYGILNLVWISSLALSKKGKYKH